MPNQHILQRLQGIQNMLMAAHQASAPLSSASKGTEREDFIDNFLSNVLPAPFRFGTGDITDTAGLKSGQLDVVVEYPFAPSLPIVGGTSSRLYLAEGVAAAIEVKSDVASQWNQALGTANALAPISRNFRSTVVMGNPPVSQVPLFDGHRLGCLGTRPFPLMGKGAGLAKAPLDAEQRQTLGRQ